MDNKLRKYITHILLQITLQPIETEIFHHYSKLLYNQNENSSHAEAKQNALHETNKMLSEKKKMIVELRFSDDKYIYVEKEKLEKNIKYFSNLFEHVDFTNYEDMFVEVKVDPLIDDYEIMKLVIDFIHEGKVKIANGSVFFKLVIMVNKLLDVTFEYERNVINHNISNGSYIKKKIINLMQELGKNYNSDFENGGLSYSTQNIIRAEFIDQSNNLLDDIYQVVNIVNFKDLVNDFIEDCHEKINLITHINIFLQSQLYDKWFEYIGEHSDDDYFYPGIIENMEGWLLKKGYEKHKTDDGVFMKGSKKIDLYEKLENAAKRRKYTY